MKAKGLLTFVLAVGALLAAPDFGGARADHNDGVQAAQQQSYISVGGWTRSHLDGRLTKRERKALKRLRGKFDNERAFRRYLRHHKPRLFARYRHHFGHQQQRHRRHHQAFDHRHRHFGNHLRQRHQRFVWSWGHGGGWH